MIYFGLIGFYIFGVLIDTIGTYLSMSRDDVFELNILYNFVFNGDLEKFLVFKVIFSFLLLRYFMYLYNKHKQLKITMEFILFVSGGFYTILGIQNLIIYYS